MAYTGLVSKESFLAEFESEVFIKTFEYESNENIIGEVSIEQRLIVGPEELSYESEIVSKEENE